MLDQTPTARVQAMLTKLGAAMTANDADAAAGLFAATSYWRDLVSFTWNITTAEGREAIRAQFAATLARTAARSLAVDGEAREADGTAEAFFTFETAVARGYGHIRIVHGEIFTLLTTMAELKCFEERQGVRRPLGARHGYNPDAKTWTEEREEEARTLGRDRQPYVVIVGGGQAGIMLGARLRQLDVPTIIVERNERPGDSWRKRYKSLCLHDPVWYDHLPYIEFPKNWPVFSPKDKLGDWLEFYAKVMELNYWGKTTATSARFDPATREWTVVVDRDGETLTLRPKHLVFATGMNGKPVVPEFPGAERFRGEQHHSSAHPGPDAYVGKRVVVIGSNNSAHDIAAAMAERGIDVTMVQRSSTHVVRSDSLMRYGLGPLYSEEAVAKGITVDVADLIGASVPYAILHESQIATTNRIREVDADFYRRLVDAGFLLDFGPDGSGITMKFLRRFSGYYIDIGASELIIEGRIRLATGQVTEITEDGVRMADGREIPADLIVYATGYGSANSFVADLVDEATADRVGKCWGLGSGTEKDPGPWEGELRNMWKPTQQEALWFHGGNMHQSRHYSQFLALQLKARKEGIETPVYNLAPSHHTR
jgi:putative flavoprotein involved in K+ transport